MFSLITIIMIAQTSKNQDGFQAGREIRHQSNLMIMGMQNVPYDVADVLNGSRYSVEEATRIAASKRSLIQESFASELVRINRANAVELKNEIKMLNGMTKSLQDIANGKSSIPNENKPNLIAECKKGISQQELSLKNPRTPRQYKTASRSYIKSAEAALKVLEK